MMTRFRPCIDLHAGQVKQIVGGTLIDSDNASKQLRTNFVSPLPSPHFASLYQKHDLIGAHVIMLGPGNEAAARDALATWPDALQVGGGIHDGNAARWIEAGAHKVSWKKNSFHLILILSCSSDYCPHCHLKRKWTERRKFAVFPIEWNIVDWI